MDQQSEVPASQMCNNYSMSSFSHFLASSSSIRLFVTPWTVAYQAPLSMEFSRQEYWSGQPVLSPGNLPNPGIKTGSPALQVDSLPSEPPGKPLNFLTMTLQDVH